MGIQKECNTDMLSADYFKDLLSPVYKELYRYIYSIAGNRLYADDILQNTLLAAYTHMSQLRDKGKFKYWIFKIAKRESICYLKNTGQEVAIDILSNMADTIDEASDPEQHYINSETRNVLFNIINNLSEEDRYIVTLYYYADIPLNEIAYILNMNINTIKTRHRIIKKKIYKELLRMKLIAGNKQKNDKILDSPGGKTNGTGQY